MPSVLPNDTAGTSPQAPVPSALNVPSTHAVQVASSAVALPAVRLWPAVQVEAVVVCGTQAPVPSKLNVPLAQGTAEVAPVAA